MPQSDSLIAFVFSHQTLIIEGIFATILGIIVVWLFFNLGEERENRSRKTPEKPKINVKEVYIAPKVPKIQPIEVKPVEAPVPKQDIPSTAQVSSPSPIVATTKVADASEALKLKNDVDNRNKKVDELEKALSQAKEDLAKMQDTSKNTEALEELRRQIAKLEGRLKEYAIIEDDIANLSIYKDENEKLRTEIALLRKKGAKSGSEEIFAAQSISGEITAAPLTVVPKAGDPGPRWPANDDESKKLMSEFDSLMNTQIKTATVETMDQSSATEGEKLIAEFQNFMKGTPG